MMLTDSAVITFYMDGPSGIPITSLKKINNSKYSLLLGFGRERLGLNIHIIDPIRQIAVFEERFFKSDPRYYFMIPADKVKNFPIIVNYSSQSKQLEFEFETPDFTKYLTK